MSVQSLGTFHRVILAGIALYVGCMFGEGYHIARSDDAGAFGFALLLFGWLGLGDSISWFANPLLIASWILVRKRRFGWAVACCAVAVPCILSFLLVEDILVDSGGGRAPITSLGWAYWLWLAAAIASLVGSIGLLAQRPAETAPNRAMDRG